MAKSNENQNNKKNIDNSDDETDIEEKTSPNDDFSLQIKFLTEKLDEMSEKMTLIEKILEILEREIRTEITRSKENSESEENDL